eukprot:CAMPEP_0197583306 /NCGR_PEP_ID=MMETSP1326-20131121/6269_1 /TAXON_ID=1155430 /ORGANISM="Genus nov. species nov., Strain RCC2288" /LENGTH=149 /DNA_ID=CAMNT_0043147513 /DNA_START=191 /DNA_END=641 /DNA_ORIENTATION=-
MEEFDGMVEDGSGDDEEEGWTDVPPNSSGCHSRPAAGPVETAATTDATAAWGCFKWDDEESQGTGLAPPSLSIDEDDDGRSPARLEAMGGILGTTTAGDLRLQRWEAEGEEEECARHAQLRLFTTSPAPTQLRLLKLNSTGTENNKLKQ